MQSLVTVIGETVKSAASIRLGEIFGGSTIRYKESITNMQYPNFFIYEVAPSIRRINSKKYTIDFLMNIRYRYVADIEQVSNLETNLDDIAFKLLTNFTYITIGKKVNIEDARCEKADGVLQFFFNVSFNIKKAEEEDVLMQYLELSEELKEEE